MMYFVNKYIDPLVTKTNLYKKLASVGQGFSPGFTVTPTFPGGVSPFTVSLLMEASPHSGENEIVEYMVDWNDGSMGDTGQFIGGFARIKHMYTYEKTGKYTGHTYYPLFIIKSKNGYIKEYNTEYTGRCCAVGVSAPEV
jgi:hypothetical protein